MADWSAGLTSDHMGLMIETITGALSGDPDVHYPAAARLEEWQRVPGYLSLLLETLVGAGNDFYHRQFAGTQLKNVIEKVWVHRDTPTITEEEKVYVRRRLLESLEEPDSKIALGVALAIAKIARDEYPNQWPEMMHYLLTVMRNADNAFSDLIQRRALLTFHHVVKEIVSKRKRENRLLFMDFANELVGFLTRQWRLSVDYFMERLMNSQFLASCTVDEARTTIERAEDSLTAVKVVYRMIKFGLKRFDDREDVMTFFNDLLERMRMLLAAKPTLPENHPLMSLVNDHLTKSARCIIEVQEADSLSFVPLLVPFLDFFHEQIMNHNAVHTPDFIVACLRFIRNVDMHMVYRFPQNIPDQLAVDRERKQNAVAVLDAFFVPERLGQLVEVVLTRYMCMDENDFRQWEEEPEVYALKTEHHEFDLRAAADKLYITLLQHHKAIVGPMVIEHLKTVYNGGNDDQAVLLRDACYMALGTGAWDLCEFMDTAAFLKNELRAEWESGPNKIMQRRIVWLMGSWATQMKDPEARHQAYRILIAAMREGEAVVKISAIVSLRHLLDDMDFNADQFIEFAPEAMEHAFNMVTTVETENVKTKALYLACMIVEQMGVKIRQLASQLPQYFPQIWAQESDHHSIKAAIITTMEKIVLSLGMHSTHIYPVLIPMIEHCVNQESVDSAVLIDDALELWENTMKTAPAMTDELVRLYGYLCQLLQTGFGELKPMLNILYSYILLGQDAFLADQGERVMSLLGDMFVGAQHNETGKQALLPCINLLIQLYPAGAPHMRDALQEMANAIVTYPEGKSKAPTLYLNIFARILLANPAMFMDFLHNINPETAHQNVLTFIEAWISRFDSIEALSPRRLNAAAFCTLLDTDDQSILAHFSVLVAYVSGVIIEVENQKRQGLSMQSFYENQMNSTTVCEEEPEIDRRKAIYFADPSNRVDLRECLNAALNGCLAKIGAEAFHALMNTVDPEVLGPMQEYLHVG